MIHLPACLYTVR